MAVKAPEAAPQAIGPYDVLAKIAQGGTGAVYKGRHRDTGQVVAIKVVARSLAADPVQARRFEQEFKAARRLKHPNIVRALEYGRDDDLPYLVLEFVDGESLGDRIERAGRLPEAEAVPIIVQVAQALHAAHTHQIIHRDVKPDNVLLTADGRAKLTDLGLVKQVGIGLELTQDFSVLGTPNFMAPEQFHDAKYVDARSDVYGLGATLYMAVTGELPFRTRSARNLLNILKKKLANELTPPRQLVPGLSEEVDFAIRRAVRAEPRQRHASCREFIAALTGKAALDFDPESLPPEIAARRGPGSRGERRAAVRFASGAATSCQPVNRVKERSWSARVQDVSATGLLLLLERRFEPGTQLIVELGGRKADGSAVWMMARVVRAVPQGGKSWSVGCAFIRRLCDWELNDLL